MDSLISLQLVFLTVLFSIRCTNGRCNQGEPTNVESDNRAPDLNITISPGLVAHVGDELTITCTADKPRFRFSTILPMDPFQVSAFTPTKVTKRCDSMKKPCVQTISFTLTKAGKDVTVGCRAQNSGGDCRIKFLSLTILERSIQKPNSTRTSLISQSTRVMSTSVSQVMPSMSLTMNTSLITQKPNSTRTSLMSQSTRVMSTSVSQVMPSMSLTMNTSLITQKNNSSSSSVQMMSSSTFKMNITLPITSGIFSPTKTQTLESASRSINTGGTRDGKGQEILEEDDKVDDVKILITVTLILVIVTLLLVFVAIVYVLRTISK